MSTTKDRAARARDVGQPGGGRSRALIPVLAVVAVIVVALVVALLASGDDDTSTQAGSDGTALATADVTVRGEPLPPLEGGAPDPAVGTQAPVLEGVSPDGSAITVEPTGEPTLLAFLAHWCPHCQAELPRLVDLMEQGELEGVRPIAVLTGTDASAPNHPPAEWLEREGWEGEVLLDDGSSSAASAYGLSSYPYLVLVDAEGQVIARSAGEVGMDGLQEFLAQAG